MVNAAPSVALAPELATRAHALCATGYTVVHAEPYSFIAVRTRWAWDLGINHTTILRVWRSGRATDAELRQARQTASSMGASKDPSILPAGIFHFRAVADVVLCDSADAGAEAFARGPVGKGFGSSYHTALVDPSGRAVYATAVWGAAFFSRVKHGIDVAATGQPQPVPTSPLGLLIALAALYPALVCMLACCGISLLVPLLVAFQKKPVAVFP
jgi:hypothetical protein